MSGFLDWFLEWIKDFSGAPVFLLIVWAIALFDSVIPIVPSETTVIIGGVSAGQQQQFLPFVIACGALGAFIGDNLAYQLGASKGPTIKKILFRGEKGEKRLAWAATQLEKRGGMLLITARFIPGGRTAITISSGLTHQPRRRFASYVAVAAIIWASYAALLGFIGGKTFEDNHTLAFVVAFAMALSVTGLVELIRWVRHRRAAQGAESEPEPELA
jgi:membrane protein DedA with SNARE-associated domain